MSKQMKNAMGGALDAIASIRKALEETEAQRDELVEALEWLNEMAGYAEEHISRDWYDTPPRNTNGADYRDALSQARAVLEKVKR